MSRKVILDPSSQHEINEALHFLISTPNVTNMTYTHMEKLSKLSECLDVKVYLKKKIVPVISQAVIIHRQSQIYIKTRLLELIESMCHIDKVIELIGQDTELVTFILGSFDNFDIKTPIQKRYQLSLFKLLSLITYEIEYESIWKTHLTSSNCLLGSHIMRILTENQPLLTFKDSLIIELLTFLELLSELTLPNEPHILEQIFRIDDLVSALIDWFNTVCINKSDENDTLTQTYWIVVDMWIKIISNIIKLTSFGFDLSDPDNDKNRAFILRATSCVLRSFINVLYANHNDESYVECLGNALLYAVGPTYRSISLFQRCFSSKTIFPIVTDVKVDIENRIEEHFDNEFIIEDRQIIKVQHTCQIIQHLCESYKQYVSIWSYKNILENIFIWKSRKSLRYVHYDWIFILLKIFNDISENIRAKIHQILHKDDELVFTCWYLRVG